MVTRDFPAILAASESDTLAMLQNVTCYKMQQCSRLLLVRKCPRRARCSDLIVAFAEPCMPAVPVDGQNSCRSVFGEPVVERRHDLGVDLHPTNPLQPQFSP